MKKHVNGSILTVVILMNVTSDTKIHIETWESKCYNKLVAASYTGTERRAEHGDRNFFLDLVYGRDSRQLDLQMARR